MLSLWSKPATAELEHREVVVGLIGEEEVALSHLSTTLLQQARLASLGMADELDTGSLLKDHDNFKLGHVSSGGPPMFFYRRCCKKEESGYAAETPSKAPTSSPAT